MDLRVGSCGLRLNSTPAAVPAMADDTGIFTEAVLGVDANIPDPGPVSSASTIRAIATALSCPPQSVSRCSM